MAYLLSRIWLGISWLCSPRGGDWTRGLGHLLSLAVACVLRGHWRLGSVLGPLGGRVSWLAGGSSGVDGLEGSPGPGPTLGLHGAGLLGRLLGTTVARLLGGCRAPRVA